MGIQSAVMAKQFGENFQYGKRRISAMTNEEFNKLTPRQMMENTQQEIKAMIPTFKQSMQDMKELQSFIIIELIDTIKQVTKDVGEDIFTPGEVPPGGLPINPPPSYNTDAIAKAIEGFHTKPFALNIGGLEGLFTTPPAYGDPTPTPEPPPPSTLPPPPNPPYTPPQDVPDQPPTQKDLLDKYDTWEEYRQNGGLLTQDEWANAKGVAPSPDQKIELKAIVQEFLESLDKSYSDLGKGGNRTRNFKGTWIEWTGSHLLTWDKTILRYNKWQSQQWTPYKNKAISQYNTASLYTLVNALKTEAGSTHVMEFTNAVNGKKSFYLIKVTGPLYLY